MMTDYELLSLVFIVGLAIPITVYGVYWFAVDSAKRYVDKEIRRVQ